MLTAWHTFFFHSDEYFQIVEFASYKLGLSPASVLTWEFKDQIRPSLQPYLFIETYKLLTYIGISNRFTIFSVVHIIIGLLGFGLCNYLIIKKFKKEQYLFILLLLTNFIGIIPVLRSSFSAETMGGLFLLLGILVVERAMKKEEALWLSLLSGFVLAFSFYFRFQVAFSLIGLALWVLINYYKDWKKIVFIKTGFLVGVAINMLLDVRFYGKFCFTPYNYFYANIIQGKAAAFGTSPWWYYVAILAVITVPFLSFFLFWLFTKSLFNYKNPFAIAIFFFIVGHSIVGHKEERFVFPVLFFMVYLAAEAYRNSVKLQSLLKNLWNNIYYGWLIKVGIGFSVIINILFVVLLAFEPYKQPIKFIKRVNEEVNDHQKEILCYQQSPYTTESGLEYHFLSQNKLNFKVYPKKSTFLSALSTTPNTPTYYCLKYEDAMNDSLYTLVQAKGIVSSPFVWGITKWLGSKYQVYIPDMWILAKYEKK